MKPADFPQSNQSFHAPDDYDSSQVMTIPVFIGEVDRGSCEGAPVIITCWQPTPQEIQDIMEGAPIFLSCIGGLPPHFLTTRFENAVAPA